ncbi:AAA family ATPase [Sphingosinicella sp. BN140058]|uniref:AAA family ATPase n=1 Tax=Sphingosinicella sp. BN140058 TaxID=1892855 RepID=UPI0010119F48|nr:MoxR family ATPase [Sphingosinicella sp. BN140058]QAY80166.1 AAA family ATPase [Sphingosinicella sp. BN140058]
MPFNANDAALAVSILSDEVTQDIDFVSMQQYEADCTAAAGAARSAVIAVLKVYGLHQLGSPDDGDEIAARECIDSAKAFAADPAAFLASVHGSAPAAGSAQPAAEPLAPAAPTDQAATAIPTSMLFEQAARATVIEEPVAQVSTVPQPMQGLFKGIKPIYNSDLMPTFVWETAQPVLPELKPHYSFDGFQVSMMAVAMDRGKPIIGVGEPGCGKTVFYEQVAARIGLPCTVIPFDGSLTRAEIIGSFRQVATPTGSATPFVLGQIPQLIQRPGIIVLDEIDQADPDIMYMLHPLLEGKDHLVIQEDGGRRIPRHPHCYFAATANTKGRGSDNGMTHVRQEMSEATRDRLPYWLEFEYMKEANEIETLQLATAMELAACQQAVKVATLIRTGWGTGELSQTCSFRQLEDLAAPYRRFSGRGSDVALALAADSVMAGRANKDDAATIRGYIQLATNVDLNLLER